MEASGQLSNRKTKIENTWRHNKTQEVRGKEEGITDAGKVIGNRSKKKGF